MWPSPEPAIIHSRRIDRDFASRTLSIFIMHHLKSGSDLRTRLTRVVSSVYYCITCVKKAPYSWKIWRKLNLADWPQPASTKKYWQILIWRTTRIDLDTPTHLVLSCALSLIELRGVACYRLVRMNVPYWDYQQQWSIN